MRYFAEVSRHPLLTPQQEITAAEKRDAGNKAIRQLVSGSFLTREQGMKLEKDVLARDAAVRELEEGNLRLVIPTTTFDIATLTFSWYLLPYTHHNPRR